ncbi:MAG: hypothetical protein ICV73_10595 [Acetobacteraceae bacterium]|nr:hypothetical protein [Acetobacteraceae bacterium]
MRLRGTKDADQLHGAAQDDAISGSGGGDLITGEGGSDRLLGGDGDDNLHGDGSPWAHPAASMPGVAGDDTLDGGAGADQLFGGLGDDLLIGGAGGDQLFGNAGSDTYRGGAGDDHHDDDGYYNYNFPVPVPAPAPAAPGPLPIDGAAAPSMVPPLQPPYGPPPDADVFLFEAPKGAAGGFGHDQVSGFDVGGDRLRFVGYTEADLEGPVRTTSANQPSWDPSQPSYFTQWQFDFRDGSRVIVSFYEADSPLDETGTPTGTAPVAGQDYAFA